MTGSAYDIQSDQPSLSMAELKAIESARDSSAEFSSWPSTALTGETRKRFATAVCEQFGQLGSSNISLDDAYGIVDARVRHPQLGLFCDRN
jgi:hypothetical protein